MYTSATQKKNITMRSTNPSMLTTQTKLSSNHLSRAVNSPAVSLPEKALPLVEIVPKDGLFDYANKYQAGGASEICPPVSLDEETQELIQRAGERAFEALRMDVYSRADFIVSDADGEFYCLEMNALPGMTAASLLPKAAKAAGYEYSELCEAIIQESIKARY